VSAENAGSLARLDLQAHPVARVTEDLQDLQGPLDLQDRREKLDLQDQQEKLDLQDLVENPEHQGAVDLLAQRVKQDL